MIPITYLVGDATEPKEGLNTKIIAHICNDVGAWGKGFTAALDKKWDKPRKAYKEWANGEYFDLGGIQFVTIDKEADLYVANMVAQHGLRSKDNPTPIDYKALKRCLDLVEEEANFLEASVHMPKIGTGLAGGDWQIIEKIIVNQLCVHNIAVYVYELS